MSNSEQERLLTFLFDRNDKEILNIKFFRGNDEKLTVDQMCLTVREVIEDTWNNEGRLTDAPPVSGKS